MNTRQPVVVSLDTTVMAAMAKMRGPSDVVGPLAGDAHLAPNLDKSDIASSAANDETLPASRYAVIVEYGQVVGLLTECDLGRLAVQQVALDQLTLRQILRRPPVTIRESAASDLVAVLNLFQAHQLSYLPVLSNTHQLVGVISSASLYRLLSFIFAANSSALTPPPSAEIALQDNQKQFKHLAENIPGMIYRLVRHFDGYYELTYVSSQVQEMFEVAPKAIRQNINNFWERIHPDDLNWLHAEIQSSAETLKPFSREHRLSLPKKGLRWVKMIAHPEQLDSGAIMWDGVVLDIGDHKQAKAELKQTNQALDRATSLKDEFLANMSYELRTPLNAILGMTEGLRDGVFGQVNAQQLKTLQTIEQSGSHQLTLIHEILDLAKIELGNLELVYSAVSITSLCQSSLAAIKPQSLEKGIQLHLNIPWNLPDIRVDEHRIRQVLVHLLSRAVQCTPVGCDVTLEVVPSLLDENKIQHSLRFVITNSGIGYETGDMGASRNACAHGEGTLKADQPEDDQPEDDQPEDDQYGRIGLSLALIKRIIELHEGHIFLPTDADMDYDLGIELPYDVAAQNPPPRSVSTVTPSSPAPYKGTPLTKAPLVLLAEDNEANIIAPSSYLQAKGYRIQVAKNGQAAIDLAQAEEPHVILMDIQMPGMDGLTAIQRIRQLPSLAQTPIIALTAFAMEGDQERCIAAGANKYLSKPVKLKQLALSIQELIAE